MFCFSCFSVFSKRHSLLTISLTCFNNFNTTDSEKIEETLAWHKHKISYWKHMPSISWFINNLYCWIHSSYILHKKLNKTLQELDWPFMSFWNLKSLYFTCFHLFRFIVLLYVIYCHSVLFAVTPCNSLSLVVPRCHMLHYSS